MDKKTEKGKSDGGRGKGALYIVGIGPGGGKELTGRAVEVLSKVNVVVGYTTYIELLSPLIEGKEVYSTGMTEEVQRCRKAARLAASGRAVALVSSGDAGIYGMAGLVLQLVNGSGGDPKFSIEVVPGVPAFVSAASILGAPLVHDFASISLSDRLTPWDIIAKRVEGAAKADFVIVLYNPRSSGRKVQLPMAVEIVSRYRGKDTPVGIVRNASRDEEEARVTTLGEFKEHYESIDMSTLVIIGSSTTYVAGGRMITPRGYGEAVKEDKGV
jgi:precorrin-3B C17-methyltransferase